MSLDESRFNVSYNDGRIRVRRYAGERFLQRHRGPTPSVIVWDEIGYNMRSRLLRTEGNLNSNFYISEVLQPEGVPLLQATPCHISAGQCPAKSGKEYVSLLPKTMGITASLACTFARYVTHRTCLGYGWSATYSSGSSCTYS